MHNDDRARRLSLLGAHNMVARQQVTLWRDEDTRADPVRNAPLWLRKDLL